MWDDGDGEMGWKGGDRLGKYRQGTITNLRDYYCSGIIGMADRVGGEDSGRQELRRRCRTTEIDTAEE